MKKFKFLPHGTAALLALAGLGAVIFGTAFIFKPDGSWFGLGAELLADSPFESFLVPGNIYFFIAGMGSLFAGFACFTGHRFSGTLTLCTGLFLLFWTLLFTAWFGWFSFLQSFFLLAGIAEFFLGFLIGCQQWENFNDYFKNRSPKDYIPWF